MTDDEQPAPRLSPLDAVLQLEVAVQQLLTPVVEQLDRSRAAADPAVAEVNEQAARSHHERMTQLRIQHAEARARGDETGMHHAAIRMLDADSDYQSKRLRRTCGRAIVPSLLTRLQAAVESTQGAGNRAAGVHRSPIGLDAAELLGHIERTVARVEGDLLGSRIRQWAADVQHAPGDDLHDAAVRATRWVDDARTILDPDRTAEVQGECPICHERYVWVDDGAGSRIRKAAVQISYASRSARCLNHRCDGRWSFDYLPHLAAVVEQDVTERKATG